MARPGPKSKLSDEQVRAMLAEKSAGRTLTWFSEKYKVSEGTISRLVKEHRERAASEG